MKLANKSCKKKNDDSRQSQRQRFFDFVPSLSFQKGEKNILLLSFWTRISFLQYQMREGNDAEIKPWKKENKEGVNDKELSDICDSFLTEECKSDYR